MIPKGQAQARRRQHNPHYKGDEHVYANLVYLTLALLSRHQIGSGPTMPIPDALLARLGLTEDKAEEVVGKVLEARDALRVLVNKYQTSN